MSQLINVKTGEFTIDNDFRVYHATTIDELMAHFGKDRLKESEYKKDRYISSQVKLDALYFVFSFCFEKEVLKKISFEIENERKAREPWSNNRDVETNWIAQQMGDNSGFVWDMNQAGRHYHLFFEWGSIGVYYDFKNGTFESSLNYMHNG